MAKRTNTTTARKSAKTTVKGPHIGVPMGFIFLADEDLNVTDDERRLGRVQTARLKETTKYQVGRIQERLLAILEKEFPGQIVPDWIDDRHTSEVVDPKTGLPVNLKVDYSDVSALFAKPEKPKKEKTEKKSEPKESAKADEPGDDLSTKSVKELREMCKAAGKKTGGAKAVLVARLSA